MSKICFTITDWFVAKVLKPIDTWVAQQQKQCKKLPWWNPLKWICWFVTVLVRVVIWVLQEILVPIVRVICFVFTFVIGGILLPIGAGFSQSFYDWVKEWFWPVTLVTGLGKKPSSVPGEYIYEFRCHCKNGKTKDFSFTIPEDEAKAQAMAADQCRAFCA